MSKMPHTLKLVRMLMGEIRKASCDKKIKDTPVVQYILGECRKYQTTDLQLCKAQEEAKYLAHTYLFYLQSSRRYLEINKEYTGKGERSVGETANMVGFKLPHDPMKDR